MELAFANDGVCVFVLRRQRDRATQHFNIPNNAGETGHLFENPHIKRDGMSAEGYAYISLALPIQQEQARRTGRADEWKDIDFWSRLESEKRKKPNREDTWANT